MRPYCQVAFLALAAPLVVLGFVACGNNAGGFAMPSAYRPLEAPPVNEKIQHIILVVQENRSFDDFFATFPGADGTTHGKMSNGKIVPLRKVGLIADCDFGHARKGFVHDYDNGKMDGFNLEGASQKCPGLAGTRPYQYVDPSQIKAYWYLAEHYVLADHVFQTQGSGSFTAHQDLIAGASAINAQQSLVDFPTHRPWGCDAPRGTVTSLVMGGGIIVRSPQDLRYLANAGPFPCFSYRTLRDVLDAASVSWKYYTPPIVGGTGNIWSAFDAIEAVRDGPQWKTHVTKSTNAFFSNVVHGTLPAVSWLIPDNENSDHPDSTSDTGPSWIAHVVNTIGESKYWPSTAIVIVWDDWGGFYDHVPPPFFDNGGGLGFRVPMLVVSPYARRGGESGGGYISHTQYEFGSILRFIEDNFQTGRIGTTDMRATSIRDCFDFNQSPRTFKTVPAKYPGSYFERQPPSYRPVDTE